MHWTEILTIVLVVAFLLFMFFYYGKKIKNGESLDECSCAKSRKRYRKGQNDINPLVAEYYAKYGKKNPKRIGEDASSK